MKKKINIGLILVVLMVWGIIGYRIVKNYFYVPEESNDYAFNYKDEVNIITQRDTFVLRPLERDPFNSKGRLHANTESVAVKPNPSLISRPRPFSGPLKPQMGALLWPTIEYYGFIKSNNNPEIYLIKADNNFIRIKKGETKNDISINKVFKDSIVLSFQKNERTFHIKK